MKRWVPIGLIVLLGLTLALSLCQPAVSPEWYTGEWYAPGGQRYVFRHGVVENQSQSSTVLEGQNYCGAYAFSGDAIAVFALGVEGLDQVRQLTRAQFQGQDVLQDAAGQIFFYRSPAAARSAGS